MSKIFLINLFYYHLFSFWQEPTAIRAMELSTKQVLIKILITLKRKL